MLLFDEKCGTNSLFPLIYWTWRSPWEKGIGEETGYNHYGNYDFYDGFAGDVHACMHTCFKSD